MATCSSWFVENITKMKKVVTKLRIGSCFDTDLKIDTTVFVAPNAVLKGTISVGKNSSIWFNAVLRGDMESISIGNETNIQDGVIIHVDEGKPIKIGDRVTVGHGAIIHGATVGNDVIVGIGSILLNNAKVGDGAVVAAGSVVREGFEVPACSVAAGVPAKIVGKVSDELKERVERSYKVYVKYAQKYRKGNLGE